MSGTGKRNREQGIEAPGMIDRALDRDRDDQVDILEGGADRGASGMTARTGRMTSTEGEIRVPVAEERLGVAKQQVELGAVEIHKEVVQEQVSVPVELMREEVHVAQRDIADRPAQAGDNLFQEGVIRVPVRGEEAVVTKQAVVTGEVVIDKEQLVERQNITDTVRRERVEVEEHYQRARAGLQQHHAQRLTQDPPAGVRGTPLANRTFEQAEANYRTGFTTGSDERYTGRTFEEVEPDLRREQGSSGSGGAWEHLREEIREGFHRARGR